MRTLRWMLPVFLFGCSTGVIEGRSQDAGADAMHDVGKDVDIPGRAEALELVSMLVEPAEVELDSVDGANVEQEFKAVGTYGDGEKRPVSYAQFVLDKLDAGDINAQTGVFRANGRAGGTMLVRARAISNSGKLVEASATLRVRVSRQITLKDVPADVETRFAQTPIVDATRTVSVVYPLKGAVMPQNVFPADVQWLVGAENDLFEVSLNKPSMSVRVFVRHCGKDFGNHYLVDETAWRSLASSDPDDPVRVRVRRWDAARGELIEGQETTFSFARAALTGSIYYWDIAAGRIVRIDDGTNKPVQFMPNPTLGCVGCHAVSPSGRYMAGRQGPGENIGGTYDLTKDLTADPAPTLFPISSTGTRSAEWWFSSWSPDERRLVVSMNEGLTTHGTLAFLNPFTGKQIPAVGTMPTSATHPAWSPDGREIAYVTNIDSWGGKTTTGDVAILPVNGTTVGKARVIHAGADLATSRPLGRADSYPSWTPDSSRIAFGHGSGSRSEDQRGALYMMSRDGSGVVRLDKASGEVVTNFQPRFSPFDSGGYFWLSFLSRRDYGNAQVGTRDKDLQQIWVTAIKKDAKPGEDPSEVAYWVPGQRTTTRNISAYWAPRPCRKNGDECSVASECCGGECRADATGALSCSPPPPQACREAGETCADSPDCCGGLLCESNVCIYPVVL